jgi:hypothetical protein
VKKDRRWIKFAVAIVVAAAVLEVSRLIGLALALVLAILAPVVVHRALEAFYRFLDELWARRWDHKGMADRFVRKPRKIKEVIAALEGDLEALLDERARTKDTLKCGWDFTQENGRLKFRALTRYDRFHLRWKRFRLWLAIRDAEAQFETEQQRLRSGRRR